MDEKLKPLQALLAKKPPKTAMELASGLEVSLPTVYRRIKALEAAGAVIATTNEPRKVTGPRPTHYRLKRRAR